jgi:hypothetical protein
MPDMVENYMDYSAETCMNMFSNGQAQIMRGVLEGPRSNIVLSVNTQNAAFASSIKVFPNPTQNEVTVSLENPNSNPHTLILRNALGQIMATHTTSASVIQHSFEMRKVSAGVYYLEIATKGKSVTKKVIFIP